MIICSPDKDLAQCVRGTRVVQRDRVRKTTRDEAGVVARFDHIEAIPEDHRAWGLNLARAWSLAATLTRDRELAGLFRQLATLRTDVPVFESVDELAWRGPTRTLSSLRRRLAVDISAPHPCPTGAEH